jgi:hypothetical protein
MKRAVLLAILFVLAHTPGHIHAQAATVQTPPSAWYACQIHLSMDFSHVNRRVCVTYPIRRAHRPIVGWTVTRTRISPHVIHGVRFPCYQAPPAPPIDVSPQARPYLLPWLGAIANASRITHVPTRVIGAIIMVESTGRQVCYSGDGLSVGLTQLIPTTAQSMWALHGVHYSWQYVHDRICSDAYFDVLTGAMYLAYQYPRFGYSWQNAAGAYNGGSVVVPGYVAKFNGWYY